MKQLYECRTLHRYSKPQVGSLIMIKLSRKLYVHIVVSENVVENFHPNITAVPFSPPPKEIAVKLLSRLRILFTKDTTFLER